MEDASQTRGFLEIRLQTNAYGVPVEFVREITQVADITPLPNSPQHICGLMNLRGQVLPVIDLSVRLGGPKTEISRESCVVVIDGLEGVVGMLVDAVVRVLNVARESIQPPPEAAHLQFATLVTSIAKDGSRMVTLLDVLHCLESPEKYMEENKGVPDLGPDAVKLLA